MKVSVLQFPGTNCEYDTKYAFEQLGCDVEIIWHKETKIPSDTELLVIPGGFSYGDYLRSGAIARFSPIMQEVVAHANKGGYVMGICNGFQILGEADLVPGALLHNNNQKFICKNVFLKPETNSTLITRHLDQNKAYKIPGAHGEGRYFADDDTIKMLNDNEQVIFRYCDENGTVADEFNPNGSVQNIAGVANKNKNVFGMMPHPERAADSVLSNEDGKAMFESILNLVH